MEDSTQNKQTEQTEQTGQTRPEGALRGLQPYLSPLGVWALAFGCSVGWGSFVFPGTTFLPIAGPLGTFLGLLAGVLLMLVIGANYHYMMCASPDAGGTYAYTRQVFGYDHGFLSAWFMLLSYIAVVWANLTAIALIFRQVAGNTLQFGWHYRLAGYDIYLGEVLTELAVLFLLEGLCAHAKRPAIWLQIVLALVLILGIMLCYLLVLRGTGRHIFELRPLFYPGKSSFFEILNVAALAPWAFVGFESITNSAEEYRFPVRRSFHLMALALGTGFLSYVLLNGLAVRLQPPGFSGWRDYVDALPEFKGIEGMPVFYVIHRILGEPGLVLLGVVVLAGIVTGIVGNSIATGRLLVALSRDGVLPSWFGEVTPEGAPRNAHLFIAAASVFFPFLGRTATVWVVDIATVGATIIYGYTSAAALRRAMRERDEGHVALGAVGVAVSVAFCLYLLIPNIWSVSALAPESYLILAAWGILGFLYFRRVFRQDQSRRFGRSTVVWIAMLFMIFFTSLMWMRQSTHQKMEEVMEGIGDFYVEELSDLGCKHLPVIESMLGAYLAEEMDSVQQTLLRNSIVQMAIILVGLMVMLSVYAGMQRRERQMEREKLAAERNSRAKSDFLSNMSHDIRTPMNAIVGYTNLAKQEDLTLAQVREYLDKIEGSSQHLLALINDVLEMSRIESGRMELEESDEDLVRMMEETRDMFSTQMAEKKIAFEVDCSDVRDRFARCDRNRLNRVLLNLISNAYKFTPTGGRILVRLSEQPGETEEGRRVYELRVRDNGIGMTEEFAARVFDAFERERTSTVSGIQGTGLGMAITKSIVDLMGGEIAVRTAQGEGTEFVVTLRFAPGEAVAVKERSETAAEGAPAVDFSTMRLLLVEDMDINREIATRLLKRSGFQVESAVNGREAVERVAGSKPGYYNAVLMDIQMPVMDGYDASRAIRALPDAALAQIPIVAMTANAFAEDVQKALDAGMNAHIAKPIDVKHMLATLTEVLGS